MLWMEHYSYFYWIKILVILKLGLVIFLLGWSKYISLEYIYIYIYIFFFGKSGWPWDTCRAAPRPNSHRSVKGLWFSQTSMILHLVFCIHFYELKCENSCINYGYVCEIMDINQWNESRRQVQILHGDTSNLWKIITWNNQYNTSMTQVQHGYGTLNEVFVLPRCKLVWKDIFLFLFLSTCFNITIRCVEVLDVS